MHKVKSHSENQGQRSNSLAMSVLTHTHTLTAPILWPRPLTREVMTQTLRPVFTWHCSQIFTGYCGFGRQSQTDVDTGYIFILTARVLCVVEWYSLWQWDASLPGLSIWSCSRPQDVDWERGHWSSSEAVLEPERRFEESNSFTISQVCLLHKVDKPCCLKHCKHLAIQWPSIFRSLPEGGGLFSFHCLVFSLFSMFSFSVRFEKLFPKYDHSLAGLLAL